MTNTAKDQNTSTEEDIKPRILGKNIAIAKLSGLVRGTVSRGLAARNILLKEFQDVLTISGDKMSDRLRKVVKAQIGLLSRLPDEMDGVDISKYYNAKGVKKEGFIKSLDKKFLYQGKKHTLRVALSHAVLMINVNWTRAAGSVIESFNNQYPDMLPLPKSESGISECLHTKEEGRVHKGDFIRICGLIDREGKTPDIKNGYDKIVSKEDFIKMLDTPDSSQSQDTLRDILQQALDGKGSPQWYLKINPILKDYNKRILPGNKVLPVGLGGISSCLNNGELISKGKFCEICGLANKNMLIRGVQSKRTPPVTKPNRTIEKHPTPKKPRISTTEKHPTPKKPRISTTEKHLTRYPPKSREFVPTPDMHEFGGTYYYPDGSEARNQPREGQH